MTASPCPKCGAELERGTSPAGLCPACLLDTALSSDDDRDTFGPAFSETLRPGEIVGPFRIVGVLGKGGMATVYEAYDERLERAIALKVLPRELLHAGAFARRFEKEARVVAKLEHPNIVPIYASGIDAGIPWMSMRLLAGGNMGMLLREGRPDAGKALHLLRSVAAALDYAHGRGVVHRDIKPTNILLDGAGGVYVGDFGLAQMLDGAAGFTRTGILTGTPQYMAPELAQGNPADQRSDIYSLAIVAYETFVGAIPFTADSPVAVLMKHVQEPLPTPPYGLVPPAVMRAIETAAAKDPGDRWPSAGAFVAALEKAVPLSPYSGRESGRRAAQWRVGWAGAAAGVLAVAGTLAWLVPQGPAASGPSTSEVQTFVPREPPSDTPQGPATKPTEGDAPLVPVNRPARPTRGPENVPPVVNPVQPPLAPPDEPLAPPPVAPTDKETTDASAEPPPPPPIDPPPPAKDDRPSESRPAPVPDVITLPVEINKVTPEYPAAARAARLEGDVLLRATVGVDGRVSNVQVLRSVHRVLEDAARKAVLQYEYAPGRRNEIPEPMTIPITVSFEFR